MDPDFGSILANPLTIFVIMAAVLGAVGLVFHLMEKKRREALAAVAAQIGFAFQPSSSGAPGDTFHSFHLFNQGHSREYRNILSGQLGAGMPALLFDYRFVTGSGKNRSTHTQSVAALYDDRANFPGFELRPENVFHKLGSLFGYQDIDFEFNPKFSSQYLLRGRDVEAIRSLFGPSVLGYFENNPGWCVEGGGDCIVVYRSGKRIDPEEVRPYLDRLRTLFSVFPK